MSLLQCYNTDVQTVFDAWLSNELPWENLVKPCTNDTQCMPGGIDVPDKLRFGCSVTEVDVPSWLPEMRNAYLQGNGFNVSQILDSLNYDCFMDAASVPKLAGVCNCGYTYGFVGTTCSDLNSSGKYKASFMVISCIIQFCGVLRILGMYSTIINRNKVYFALLSTNRSRGAKYLKAGLKSMLTSRIGSSVTPSRIGSSVLASSRVGSTAARSRARSVDVTQASSSSNKNRNAALSRTRMILVTAIILTFSSFMNSVIFAYEFLAPIHAEEHTDARMLITVLTMIGTVIFFVEVNLIMSMHVLHIVAMIYAPSKARKARSEKLQKRLKNMDNIKKLVKLIAYSLVPTIVVAILASPTIGDGIVNSMILYMLYFGFVLLTLVAGPWMLRTHVRKMKLLLKSGSNMGSNPVSKVSKTPVVPFSLKQYSYKNLKQYSFKNLKLAVTRSKEIKEDSPTQMVQSIITLCTKNLFCIIGVMVSLAFAVLGSDDNFMVMVELGKLSGICTAHTITTHLSKVAMRKAVQCERKHTEKVSSCGTLTS